MNLIIRFLLLIALTQITVFAETMVYFGTYTGSGSEGIYFSTFDSETGEISEAQLAIEESRSPFIAIHPNGKRLYSVANTLDDDGNKTDGVSAYKILEDGSLSLINRQPSMGAGPCYVSLNDAGTILLAANYHGGSITSYPLDNDGAIGTPASAIQHVGSSIHKGRQDGPHAHSIVFDPSNQRAYAVDLGMDKIKIYKIDPETGSLSENDFPFVSISAGGGPRHLIFNASGNFAYTNLEMTSEVAVLKHNPDTGEMEVIQTLSTLPENIDGSNNSTAEIRIHPSGKFLYVSNRGHNSIAIYTVDQKTGMLTYSTNESTMGKTPRGFEIDPSGNFIVAANQDSNDAFVFRINQETGLLSWTGNKIEVPTAVCVRFVVR